MWFPSSHRTLDGSVKDANTALEQTVREHRRATERATEAMEESVKIAQEALRKHARDEH